VKLHVLATIALLAPSAYADPPKKPQGNVVSDDSSFKLQPATRAFKRLQIDNPLGDVRVEGHDSSDLVIETHKSGPDDASLERLRISLIPNPDGTVRLKTTADKDDTQHSLARGLVRIDVVVHAPRDLRVEAVTRTGRLEIANMDKGADLDTSSGVIVAHNVQGDMSTHSVSGQTTLTTVFGSIDAETISADLQLDSINGERLVASANHGNIAGRRVRSREIELTTMDGKITLEGEIATASRFIIASLRGDIDVKMRRRGMVIVRAYGAKVNLDQQQAKPALPNQWVQAQYGQLASGETAASIELRATNGLVSFGILQ
jgi:hypothetical protein